MTIAPVSLCDYTSGQLARLCEAVGFSSAQTPVNLLQELLGPAGERSISEPPQWPSDIADDTTPVEFSVNFGRNGRSAVRILGETVAGQPSNPANVAAARRLMTSLAQRYDMNLDRFRAVEDLFLPPEPKGKFGLWYSFIFKPDRPPQFKIYLNPDARGPELAANLVAIGMQRLGFGAAYEGAVQNAFRRSGEDHFAFFSLDLDNTPTSRVKLYVAHQAASAPDVAKAATAVTGVDPQHVEDFCTLVAGRSGPFAGRPLISSYTYVADEPQEPRTYTLYVPIRDYVHDDEEARRRIQTLMTQQNLDSAALTSLIDAVTDRPLHEGVGLIAHVSLRLGDVEPGMTVYLSSEAYGGTHGACSAARSQRNP